MEHTCESFDYAICEDGDECPFHHTPVPKEYRHKWGTDPVCVITCGEDARLLWKYPDGGGKWMCVEHWDRWVAYLKNKLVWEDCTPEDIGYWRAALKLNNA